MQCPDCGQWSRNGGPSCRQCCSAFSPPANPRPILAPQGTTGGITGGITGGTTGGTTGPDFVPWRGGQVALGIISVIGAFFLLLAIIASTVGVDDLAVVTLLTSLVLGLVILGAVASIGLRWYRVALPALGITSPTMPGVKVILMTVGVLILSLGATGVYAALVEVSGFAILEPPEIPAAIVLPGVGAAITFLALVVWTPFTEEVFFRGFVFAGLVPRFGSTRAMIASALIFSVFHIAPGVLIPIFITGLLLAWLYRRTGTLWPCIAAHAGQNAIALAVTQLGL